MDPFTAFAMAQAAVAGIKKAVALGKDINGLIHEFSGFYKAADEVHTASVKLKIQSIRMSDAEIGAKALQIAMASKALREHEKELRDMLIWSGNAPVYEEMMAERKRMKDARDAEDKRIAEQQQKDREAKAQAIMATLWIMGAILVIGPLLSVLWYVITNKGL